MYRFTSRDGEDLDELRVRLAKMSDVELLRFGNAAEYMCSLKANFNKPPGQPFVIQLEEARAEWHRRYPKTSSDTLPETADALLIRVTRKTIWQSQPTTLSFQRRAYPSRPGLK